MRISDWSSDVCSSDLHARRIEIGDELGYAGHGAGDRLAETRPPGGDQRFVLGEARDQFGRGLSEGAAGVVLEMPVVRDDIAQERIERPIVTRSEEHTSEIQSLMSISYAVFCLQKTKKTKIIWLRTSATTQLPK